MSPEQARSLLALADLHLKAARSIANTQIRRPSAANYRRRMSRILSHEAAARALIGKVRNFNEKAAA